MSISASNNENRITKVVRRIPCGRVATYGQIAELAGIPRNARQVGTVLKMLPDESTVPWHRVVNSAGRISERGLGGFEGLQRHLLEREGVEFDERERVDLSVYQWRPRKA